MSANQDKSEKPSPSKPSEKLSRRSFGKLFARALAATTGTLLVAREAVHAVTNRIKVGETEVIPLYEVHNQHAQVLTPEKLPDQASGLFVEFVKQGSFFTEDGQPLPEEKLLFSSRVGADSEQNVAHQSFSDQVLAACAQRQIPILFADVASPDLLRTFDMSEPNNFVAALTRMVVSVSAGAPLIVDTVLPSDMPTSRRKFLRRVGSVALLGGSMYFTNWATNQPFQHLLEQNISPLNRIISRIQALEGHLTPEVHEIFLRNLVAATKMLFYIEQQKLAGKNLPLVFNFHWGHSGIEDFLQLGLPLCRELLRIYPRQILQKYVDFSGGLQDFCSTRAIDLSADFRSGVEDGKRQILQGSAQTKRVFDQELFKLLQ